MDSAPIVHDTWIGKSTLFIGNSSCIVVVVFSIPIKSNELYFFVILQNLRKLSALSIADMGPIPTDLLQSFDQLKVLNVSGNSLVNTSLQILDYVSNIEVSS